MGVIIKLFTGPKENEKKPNILDVDDNLDHYSLNRIDAFERIDAILCLKIYIFGTGDKKEYIINNLFRDNITDNYLKTIADKEFQTEQFHWIARINNDAIITNEKCKEIRKEIKEDKCSNKNKILKYQVILCFGNENTKILSENFIKFRRSRMIFVTDSECELDAKIDKRYVTNIISKGISNEQLNIQIISALWELDCCFNEKGNQICRYTPEKIFNGLEKDNSLFSINILLTGLSRSGKSTFINLIAGKILALEADASESVTKNLSEYYIYKDDDKDEHGCIKIIDTPGIVPNNQDKDNEYQNVQNKVINMIKEQDKSFENQIHFIFFVLTRGSSLEGENIVEVLKVLNKSKCPVYFIINKVKENTEPEDVIDPITEYLSGKECKNLEDEDKFILVNFKEDKGEAGNIHGVDKIFKNMYDHIKNKNYLNKDLNEKMKNLIRDFRSKVEPHKSFLSYERENKLLVDKLKSDINFEERMKEINGLTSKNDLFSKIDLASIVTNGRKIAKNCRDVIISLSNLKDIFPSSSGDLPVLAIFQAFMVKEIGEGYGFDINILNSGTKLLINKMKKIVSSMNISKIDNKKDNNDLSDILDPNEINRSLDIIKNKMQDKLEKSNKDSILSLANLLNQIKEMFIEKEKVKEKKETELELINQKFTNDVYKICLLYFEKELFESEGLTFMINYFNKCEKILEDFEYYINKKDWGNYNIKIKV